MGEVKLKRREFLKLGGITCLASTLIAPLNNLVPFTSFAEAAESETKYTVTKKYPRFAPVPVNATVLIMSLLGWIQLQGLNVG